MLVLTSSSVLSDSDVVVSDAADSSFSESMYVRIMNQNKVFEPCSVGKNNNLKIFWPETSSDLFKSLTTYLRRGTS